MGRPLDDIWALHTLEPTRPKKKWTCKYCKKEFAGSATRVREHLFLEAGKNISRCSVFNLSSDSGEKGAKSGEKGLKGKGQKKGAKRSSNKRGRSSSSPSPSREGVSDQGNIPSSHTDTTIVASVVTPSVLTNKQESTDDLLVKFFTSNNIPLDLIKDPILMSLMTRVAQDGVPSCLHRDDKLVIEKSVFNWEYEVKEYMVLVKESWSTTGCTLIGYNFNLEKHTPIYGFYSPKGFIFVEGPHSDSYDHIRDALKKNVLNLSIDDVTRRITHDYGHTCELIYQPNWIRDPFDSRPKSVCVLSVIQMAWDKICEESKWVEKLIQRSEKLYKLLSHPDASTAGVQVVFKKHGDGMPMSSFARLDLIMQCKDRIILLSGDAGRFFGGARYEAVKTIDDKEFWEDGEKLTNALKPVLEVIHLVDTLCPVVPYIQLAIDRATRILKSCYHRDRHKFQQIWVCFKERLHSPYSMEFVSEAAFLSPIYNMKVSTYRHYSNYLQATDIICRNPELKEEPHRYESHNPFVKVEHDILMKDHPVKLWEQYGGEFPMLKAHAIKKLSVVGSCMCNQIKKKLEQIQGCDNVVMRLNYKMMEEFKKLGDSIYIPPPKWTAKESDIGSREESESVYESEESDIQSDEEAVASRIVETNGPQPEIANPCGLISTETATHPQPLYPTSFTGASYLVGHAFKSLKQQDYNWHIDRI